MFRWRRFRFVLVAALVLTAAAAWAVMNLTSAVQVVYDDYHVPTIRANNELDAIYALGYVHARDRFFQMDYQRRLFSGTLAELVGPAALPSDVQVRTLGLRRAAERGLAVQTPEIMAWLEAYSDGVNAFLNDDIFGNVEDSCSDGGDSSDDSLDGHSADSSDERSAISGDSAGAARILNQLPPEYGALEIDRNGIPDWTPLDSLTMAKGLAFSLSFDLGDIDRTFALQNFLGVGGVLGFNGLQLYGADLYPSAPFDSALSIPPSALEGAPAPAPTSLSSFYLHDPNLQAMLQGYRDEAAEIPILERALESDFTRRGSNWFLASGANTVSGDAMIANDPHLALDTPATFYEAHIQVRNGINVAGVTFPGAPGVVQGCTDVICWGSSVHPMDVTDIYQEVLVPLGPDPTQPTHTLFDGVPEPLQFIPQTFLFNNIGDGVPNTIFDANIPPESGGVTLIVPRRNNGPIVRIIVDLDSPTPITGISVQYVGWSATQELETFRQFIHAQTPDDFKEALQFFDVGSQNWAYADVNGNIAYFTSGELPIREDLQTLFFPDGIQPPYFIRNGAHDLMHEWLDVQNPQPHQALNREILPFDEMPQVVNPPSGIILNANNDTIGTTLDNVPWNEFRAGFNGRLYFTHSYAAGFRMGRIQRLFDEALAGGGKLSQDDFIAFQANNQLLDAEVFRPFLLDAFDNASASGSVPLSDLAADPEIAEAVGRLAAWDFSTPTGITEGFDPGDVFPQLPPTQAEIDASVAATIYSTWRGQLVQRVIDGTLASLPIPLDAFAPPSAEAVKALRRLLDAYPIRGGVGLSLINFFNEPDGATALERRDLILLRALRSALDLLASDEFAPAFANSTIQDDYRWGKLHRIVLAHPLGGPFNLPPAGSPANVAPDLPGFARAGGFGAVDASSHGARADGLNDFMFDRGPARRLVATMTSQGPVAFETIPGGQSGVPGSPFQADQLINLWLVNDFHPLPLRTNDVFQNAQSCQNFVPPPQSQTTMEPPEFGSWPDSGLELRDGDRRDGGRSDDPGTRRRMTLHRRR